MNAPATHISLVHRRPDLVQTVAIVEPHARVLDVGCEDGTLLQLLKQEKHVKGRGLELSQEGVNACVARGLSVIQGDADTDLQSYPDRAFDYVILTQTIQATRKPRQVLSELLRIGRHAIISFPNFGHWRVRLSLLLKGGMPMTPSLDVPWHETPNIHLCSIKDFVALCQEVDATIDTAYQWSGTRAPSEFSPNSLWANLMAEQAMFVLRRSSF